MANRVLLTGISGFIGSHCVEYFLENTNWEIIGLDSFRNKGTYSRIQNVKNVIAEKNVKLLDRLKIYKHDLTVPIDSQLENQILEKKIDDRGNVISKPIHIIINMASDSAVERSTSDPVYCLKNNYDLTINTLEFARKIKPRVFFQISTDEVYGEALGDPHKEWDSILPSNPYAASKAAQEAVAISYWRTFDVPVVLTNTMNNIAERQNSEKFLPKIIGKIATNQTIPIYADSPEKIGSRFYLDAKNHADALVFLSEIKPAMYADGADKPDRYNVCGDTELNNLEMAQLVAEIMKKDLKYEFIQSESARRGYDRRYALDGSKLAKLGWKAPIGFRESIERIVAWTTRADMMHWLF